MSSTNEEVTSAAAQQLGSVSLGESLERKVEPENNEDADKNEAYKLLCSACGKESNALKMCSGCKCVWYCDVECRDRHRKEHKKECKLIKKELDKRGGKRDLGDEMDLGPLPDLPPQEECPICMRVMPLHPGLQLHSECCGKHLCAGCDFQHWMKSRDETGQTPVPRTCVFCRTVKPRSDKEILARLRKRVQRKDIEALRRIALKHGFGQLGLSVDPAKCIDLLRQSAGLGSPLAQTQLASFHWNGEMGLEQSEREALKYYEKAAEGGHVLARHNLGCKKDESGDHDVAMRYWRLSASVGYSNSMELLIECFENGLLHHSDLAKTLRVFYRARAEMKSVDRDEYIEYLKRTGEYHEDYDS